MIKLLFSAETVQNKSGMLVGVPNQNGNRLAGGRQTGLYSTKITLITAIQ